MSQRNTKAGAPADKQEGQMGKWAPYYDLIMAVMTLGNEKKLRRSTIKLSRLKPGDKVLEIGCGTGTLTIAAKRQVGPSGEAAAIDIAPEMVAAARRKVTRKGVEVSLAEGSIARIPFQDSSFDVVMCSFMIFHMPEVIREQGLTEIYRVLKPGGYLFILDSEPLDGLASSLRKNSFSEVERGKIKFIFMGLYYLRWKAEKYDQKIC